MANGPLDGLRVVEIAGIGPGPFCGMLLADLGADVVRVERPGGGLTLVPWDKDSLNRGKRSISADLRTREGVELTLDLAARADVMFEGFRPGTAERLGIGPEPCMERNPALVYGRMTGWGQDGPLATAAGHDIDYIALTGLLHSIGEPGRAPIHPLNLAGDFGGGALYLAFGLLAAVYEARSSGRGQVVDAAMIDGSASLMTTFFNLLDLGMWREQRGVNILDGGAPFYRCYRTADDRYMAVGAVEPQFFAELIRLLGLPPEKFDQMATATWPAQRKEFEAVFASRTRDEWSAVFEGSDACVFPVLAMSEARAHPHLVSRGTFVDIDGAVQPAPAPRFSRTPATVDGPPCTPGQHGGKVPADWRIKASAPRKAAPVDRPVLSGGRVVSLDGTRLGYLRIGSGPTVLCVHGSLATGRDWLPVARLLADRYTFVLADRRGHGASDGGATADRVSAEVDDLTALIEAVSPVHGLVSHSYGAIVAMHTLLTPVADQVDALVAYEPPLMMDPESQKAAAARCRALLDEGRYEEAFEHAIRANLGMSDSLVAGMRRDPRVWADLVVDAPVLVAQTEAMADVASVFEPFQAIRKPTLLLHGERSHHEPFGRSIETLAATIPHTQVVRLPDQAHAAMLQDPQRVADKLAGFLGRP